MVLGIDVGTTTVKCATFDAAGSLIATEREPVLIDGPAAEIDADLWLQALRSALARLLAHGERVATCVVTGNGPTLVPVDAVGKPTGRALTWLHACGQAEAREVTARTAVSVDASFPLPKALWLARARPEVYAGSRWLISCPEWIVLLLTGCAHTAIGADGFDRFYWSENALSALELDRRRFPPFAVAGQEIGRVTASAYAYFGVSAGAQVYAGASDFQMALLGSATVHAGSTLDRCGSSEGVNHASVRHIDDPRLISGPHMVAGLFNVAGVTSASGRAIDWLAESATASPVPVATLMERGARSAAGARGVVFLSHLNGERTPSWNPSASASFLGLTVAHTWDDLCRAVLESIGFAIRRIVSSLDEHACHVTELTACGGPARFPLWNQIKADITGVPVRTLSNPWADLVGCACVALTATHSFRDLAEAAEALVQLDKTYEPDRALTDVYAQRFGTYVEASTTLEPLYPRLRVGAPGETAWA